MTLEELPVGEAMSTDLLAVTDGESAVMAWELMRKGGYHHLPVVANDGRLIDVLDAETLAAVWDSGGPDRMRRPVGDFVGARPLPRVTAADRVATAARAMRAAGIDFVPVVDDNGRLVGLFTARDLVALAAGERPHAAGHGHVTVPLLYRIEPVIPRHEPYGATPAD
jgi:CBS domain-containing protein